MTKLLIVESPAKAKTINKYLGKDYVVMASYGHVRDLPSKNGSVDVNNNFVMHYEVSKSSVDNMKKISSQAELSDEILLATDPDREGEAISWHIAEILKSKKKVKDKPFKRIVFNEITKNAVLEAIKNPRDVDINLVNAQQARRALDYLVGFNLSPILWRKLPGSKSAGRVQSVALRILCERELERERFIEEEYWDIKSEFTPSNKHIFKSTLVAIDSNKLEKFSFRKEEDISDIVCDIKTKQYKVKEIQSKESYRNPQAPFTTSTLQQEASRKLGFSTKMTMQVAQKLYEGIDVNGETIGLITYMRTDGVQVSEEAIKNTRSFIDNNYGKEYLPKSAKIYQTKAKNAQEAHEAIRPTDVSMTPDFLRQHLNDVQYKLYKLIWQRLVASQMNPQILDVVTVNISDGNNKYLFRTTGTTVKFDGFTTIYQEGKEDEDADDVNLKLPIMKEGQDIDLINVLPQQHFTEPQPRYSEASLVKKLEELGIGRPSTYATIISVLQDRKYVVLDKKKFIPQDRGILVNAFLSIFFERYVEYNFTAELENKLDDVSSGDLDWIKLLNNFWNDFNDNINKVSDYKIEEVLKAISNMIDDHIFPKKSDGSDVHKCPDCSDGILSLKLGKFGAFIACNNYPTCKHTRQIDRSDEDEGNGESSNNGEYPKLIGYNENNVEITIRKGPYGLYLQLGGDAEEKKNIKRTAIPKELLADMSLLTLEKARTLTSLPKILGYFNEKEISLSIGKFGPYLSYNGKFYSLAKEKDFLLIDESKAIVIIEKQDSSPKKSPKILREFSKYSIILGGFGVKYAVEKSSDKKFKLSKNVDIENISEDDLEKLVNKK